MNKSFFGWTGKFLRIDLSRRSYAVDDTLSYAKTYIGGRGIAAKIAWDEIPRGVIAFSEENPLILFPGPLTGTSAPYSGRTTVCTLAPQGYPHEWYTRSSFGGHWGPELKYAGWDGPVITGRADKPLYLMIANDQVDFLDAGLLWGRAFLIPRKLSWRSMERVTGARHRANRREVMPHLHYCYRDRVSLRAGWFWSGYGF